MTGIKDPENRGGMGMYLVWNAQTKILLIFFTGKNICILLFHSFGTKLDSQNIKWSICSSLSEQIQMLTFSNVYFIYLIERSKIYHKTVRIQFPLIIKSIKIKLKSNVHLIMFLQKIDIKVKCKILASILRKIKYFPFPTLME